MQSELLMRGKSESNGGDSGPMTFGRNGTTLSPMRWERVLRCALLMTIGLMTTVGNVVSVATGQVMLTMNQETEQEPDEAAPPVIKIITPDEKAVTESDHITVSGTVADPLASASGVARITVNGIEATRDVMAGKWMVEQVPLTIGVNTITVSAVDHAGNVGTQTTTVTRRRRAPVLRKRKADAVKS